MLVKQTNIHGLMELLKVKYFKTHHYHDDYVNNNHYDIISLGRKKPPTKIL